MWYCVSSNPATVKTNPYSTKTVSALDESQTVRSVGIIVIVLPIHCGRKYVSAWLFKQVLTILASLPPTTITRSQETIEKATKTKKNILILSRFNRQ